METRRQAHAVYRAQYHIVIMPRYRYKVLTKGVREYLEIKLDEVKRYHPELEYIERNIQEDHVHLVLSFPPKYSGAQVVGIIKQNTGRALRDKFDFIRERYYGRGGMWSVGYLDCTPKTDHLSVCSLISSKRRVYETNQTNFSPGVQTSGLSRD